MCAAGGLDVIALTDHDLAPALAPGPREIDGRPLHLIAGTELSGVLDGREYHVLVYFPGEIPPAFRAFCAAQCRERAERYDLARASLGLPPSPDPTAADGARALTRLHLAHALIDAGLVRSRTEAFTQHLGDHHGKVRPLSLPFDEAIRVARDAGGLTSWAHPPRPALDRYVERLVAAGLQGLEGLRPGMSSDERKHVRKVANRFGLYLTGGSDWHGWDANRPGLFRVTAAEIQGFVDALRAA